MLDADGDPTNAGTADTEVSIDYAAYGDCTNEVTAVGTGTGYLTLTGDETNGNVLLIQAKDSDGSPTAKNTVLVVYPRVLPVLASGTAQAGGNTSITLAADASAIENHFAGALVKTTGGTGGAGGSGSANNQVRRITAYNATTKVCTVTPAWETNPSSDTTYEILWYETAYNAVLAGVDTATELAAEFDVVTIEGKFYRSATKDQYVLIPCLNGIPIAQASISTPLISVLLKDDTVVVNAQTPVVFGTKAWVHEETSTRLSAGQVAEVAFTFTYGGAEYTRYCSVGRNA